MDELLPHYERELAILHTSAAEFAQRYPKVAGQLDLGTDTADPHVERLMQAFALLSARIHKRLDDDFPLFTESFLEVLYPHYLRPFPSCSIAQFVSGAATAQSTKIATVPRGTTLTARPVRGVDCRFTSAFDVAVLPLVVLEAHFEHRLTLPTRLCRDLRATSQFMLRLELRSTQIGWAALGRQTLRFFIAGDASQVAAVHEVLTTRTQAACALDERSQLWTTGCVESPASVGYRPDEALLPTDARSHDAYRLLTEYFAFPEKFHFVDIEVDFGRLAAAGNQVTLYFALDGVDAGSDTARLLDTVGAQHFLLGCTPVVNLFAQRADPVRLTRTAASYPVVADGRRAHGYEIFSIDRVSCVRQTLQGEQVLDFRPLYSLQHEHLRSGSEDGQRYWTLHRDTTLAAHSPGYEAEIAIVDIDFNPAVAQTDTLSIELQVTNRDLPTHIAVGMPGGDLFVDGGARAQEVKLLRRPSTPVRFDADRGALWRLISHLSLNHLSLTSSGLDGFKEMLRLYDLPRSASNRRILDGSVDIAHRATTACMAGQPFVTFVRGTEVTLTVDEDHFVGAGLHTFAQVIDHFLGLYAAANSFTELRVVSSRTGEELLNCPRRAGAGALL